MLYSVFSVSPWRVFLGRFQFCYGKTYCGGRVPGMSSQSAGRLESMQGLADGGHVVNAEDLHPLPGERHGHFDRAGDRTAGEESLPRMADQDGTTQLVKSPDACQQLQIVLGRLAESDARIEGDAVLCGTGGQQGIAAAAQITRSLRPRRQHRRDCLHGERLALNMHQADPAARRDRQREHGRIVCRGR